MSRSLFLLAILALCSLTLAHKYDDIKRLQVGVKYRPQECSVQVQDGDTIDVHYAGRHFSNISSILQEEPLMETNLIARSREINPLHSVLVKEA
jgi:hypothetical protein